MEDIQIYEKIDDKQITACPKCHVEGCKNNAICLIGNVFVCGEHTIIFEKNKNKIIQSMFKDDN